MGVREEGRGEKKGGERGRGEEKGRREEGRNGRGPPWDGNQPHDTICVRRCYIVTVGRKLAESNRCRVSPVRLVVERNEGGGAIRC